MNTNEVLKEHYHALNMVSTGTSSILIGSVIASWLALTASFVYAFSGVDTIGVLLVKCLLASIIPTSVVTRGLLYFLRKHAQIAVNNLLQTAEIQPLLQNRPIHFDGDTPVFDEEFDLIDLDDQKVRKAYKWLMDAYEDL